LLLSQTLDTAEILARDKRSSLISSVTKKIRFWLDRLSNVSDCLEFRLIQQSHKILIFFFFPFCGLISCMQACAHINKVGGREGEKRSGWGKSGGPFESFVG